MRVFTILLTLLTAGHLLAAEPRYGISVVDAAALWPVTKGSGVKVGIIDTGIDFDHPGLRAAYRGGYDFVHNDSIAEEETAEAHGTFVAGVVLQVAPEAEIYALKIFGKEDSFETSDLVRAIDWAIAHHLDVLNMSFALKTQFDNARHALDRAEAVGIIVVAAAGNASSAVDYPAVFDTTIAVGAVDAHRVVASFSNHGPELDLAAPGVDIYSLAAHGSGLVATLTSDAVTISATAFTGTRTGDVTGMLIDCGIGRIDQIPAAASGNVAMLRMDSAIAFAQAFGNVIRAGAAAIVVVNSETRYYYSNVNPAGVAPPTISIGSDDAERLTPGSAVRIVEAFGDYSLATGRRTPHRMLPAWRRCCGASHPTRGRPRSATCWPCRHATLARKDAMTTTDGESSTRSPAHSCSLPRSCRPLRRAVVQCIRHPTARYYFWPAGTLPAGEFS